MTIESQAWSLHVADDAYARRSRNVLGLDLNVTNDKLFLMYDYNSVPQL